MVKQRLNLFFKITAFITASSFALVGIVSYRTVMVTVSRPSYSEKKLAEIALHKNHLINDLGAQEVQFETQDNITLHGYLLTRPEAKRNILIFHGYKATAELMSFQADLFPHDNILLFDFRAHGASGGDYVSFGYHEMKDVYAAAQFLNTNEKTKNLPLYGIGLSMGGTVLLGAQLRYHLFQALVIDSTFANLESQITRSFERKTGLPKPLFLPMTKAMFGYVTGVKSSEVSSAEYVKSITIPILFIHSENDDMIPVGDVYTLYENAAGKKELWIIKECKHGHICRNNMPEYKKRVTQFFDQN
jgi:pimeloyl-ACP methyl ester carboxylesterase